MNGIFDFFHKMMVPSTYNCSLCMITYNYTGMRKAWKTYLDSLPVPVDFLHKDEFRDVFPASTYSSFPIILAQSGDEIRQLVSPEELNESDLPGLIGLINKQVKPRKK